jgi:hypothetical protein
VLLVVAFDAATPGLEARADQPNTPGARSLDHAVIDAAAEAAGEISECAGGDRSSGDVILDVRTDGGGRPAVSSWHSASVSSARARCIEAAIRWRLRREPELVGRARFQWDVPVGSPPLPLAPATQALPAWLQLVDGGPGSGRAEFARRFLSADVALSKDGCLVLPRATNLETAFGRWLDSLPGPIAAFWMKAVEATVTPSRGKQPQPELHRAFLPDAAHLLLVTRPPGPERPSSSPGMRACLIRAPASLRKRLSERVDAAVRCVAGSLEDRLLRPRIAFPSDRRYARVAVGGSQVCALDGGGQLTCCGVDSPGRPRSGQFAQIVMRGDQRCAIGTEGTLTCWTTERGASTDASARYRRVGLGWGRLCASTADTLRCWPDITLRQPRDVARGSFQELAIGRSACGLLADRSIRCFGPSDNEQLTTPPGYSTIAAADGLCAVAADGRLRCWQVAGGGLQEAAPPISEPLLDLAIAPGGRDGCGLTRQGARLVCWGALAQTKGSDQSRAFSAVAVSDSAACTVDRGGGIHCRGRVFPALKDDGTLFRPNPTL